MSFVGGNFVGLASSYIKVWIESRNRKNKRECYGVGLLNAEKGVFEPYLANNSYIIIDTLVSLQQDLARSPRVKIRKKTSLKNEIFLVLVGKLAKLKQILCETESCYVVTTKYPQNQITIFYSHYSLWALT